MKTTPHRRGMLVSLARTVVYLFFRSRNLKLARTARFLGTNCIGGTLNSPGQDFHPVCLSFSLSSFLKSRLLHFQIFEILLYLDSHVPRTGLREMVDRVFGRRRFGNGSVRSWLFWPDTTCGLRVVLSAEGVFRSHMFFLIREFPVCGTTDERSRISTDLC